MWAFSIGGCAAIVWMCTGLAALGWSNPNYASPMAGPAATCSVICFAIAIVGFMAALGWAMDGNGQETMLAFCIGGSAMVVCMCSGLALLASRSDYSEVSKGVTTCAAILFAIATPLSAMGLIGGLGFAIHTNPMAIMVVWCIAGTGIIVLCVVVLCCVGTYYQNLPTEEELKAMKKAPPAGEAKVEVSAPPPPPPVATKVMEVKKVVEPVKPTAVADVPPPQPQDLEPAPPLEAPKEMDIGAGDIPEPVKEPAAGQAEAAMSASPATSAPDGTEGAGSGDDAAVEIENEDNGVQVEDIGVALDEAATPNGENNNKADSPDTKVEEPSQVRQPWWKSKCGPSAAGSYKTPGCTRPNLPPGCARPNLPPGCARPVSAAVACAPIRTREIREGTVTPIKSCRGNLLPKRAQPTDESGNASDPVKACVPSTLLPVKPQTLNRLNCTQTVG